MIPKIGMRVRFVRPNSIREYRKCTVGSTGIITGFNIYYVPRQWPIKVTWDDNGLTGDYCARELQFSGHQR